MKSMRMVVIVAAALAISGLMAGAAHAGASAEVGGYFSGSFPTGDWGDVAGFGLGLENATTVFPDSTKPFGIRQGASFIYNFGHTVDVPAANLDTNTSLQVETANTSLWFGIGPAFSKHTGNMRPFLYGTIGVAFNWIDSHLKGSVQGAGYDATVGQTSTTFAWTAGAGLSKAISSVPGGRLQLSAEYRSCIDQDYMLPGKVSSSGSSVSWERTHQNADQIIVRIGILTGS
jgi:opacity protein-like surface antigen